LRSSVIKLKEACGVNRGEFGGKAVPRIFTVTTFEPSGEIAKLSGELSAIAVETTRCRTSAAGVFNAASLITDFWDEFQTDWVCLDCELMPWSVKAQQLLRQQYAPVGCAAKVSLGDAISVLERAQARGIDVPLSHYQDRSQLVHQYTAAYRHYCWKVESISDFKLAPFHILATEGAVHTDKSHLWHLEQIAKFAKSDPELILATAHHTVDTNDPESVATGIDWWLSITQTGGEGMVVKPIEYIPSKRSIQPAVKCRGQEYLRIIYGAEYSLPEHLDRLRQRGLSGKRSLALREFALGIESLDQFVAKEPLRRVHECTFGVLALESESIDPRKISSRSNGSQNYLRLLCY
jgi:protein phosphatase